MATNPYTNKVVINNQTILDLTADTVDAAHLMQGYTAHDHSGAPIVGTATGGKTIANIRTTEVPTAWDNTTLVIERVDYDSSTDVATLKRYTVDVTSQASRVLTDYSIMSFSYNDSGFGVPSVKLPNGESASATLESTETVTSPAYGSGGHAHLYVAYPVNANFWLETGAGGSSGRRILSGVSGVRSVSTSDGLTYTVIDNSGVSHTVTFAEETGSVGVDSISMTGFEQSPSEYGPGYLVTYTDGTTETFPANSADIADGGAY